MRMRMQSSLMTPMLKRWRVRSLRRIFRGLRAEFAHGLGEKALGLEPIQLIVSASRVP
jgi:hypothetical protein